MIEQIDHGNMTTPFLRFGDTVEVEMLDDAGRSIFGTIAQRVAQSAR